MTTLPFLVGAAMADITPPLEAGILMSALDRAWAPFEGVRRPLYARAVVIEREGQRVALVSLELIGLAGQAVGGRRRFKSRVVAAAGQAVKATNLILASTHTHSAPESLAITNLYQTPAFQGWVEQLAQQVGLAIKQATETAQLCQLRIGTTQAAGLGIYRRIKTTDGIVLSHPPPPPEKIISWEGPVDDDVNVAAFTNEAGQIVALLVNATCHPVHEMCIPQIAPDYPGEMSLNLEGRYPGTIALFLNGAAGNINPPTVSGGAGDAINHGQRLAQVVADFVNQLEPVTGTKLAVTRQTVSLPARTLRGGSAANPLTIELTALRLGEAAYLFLPGELFVELGLAIRGRSPFPFTAIVGYSEDAIGYIPTEAAFDEGGYELGPGPWARVGRGGGEMVERAAVALLEGMR